MPNSCSECKRRSKDRRLAAEKTFEAAKKKLQTLKNPDQAEARSMLPTDAATSVCLF